MQYQGRQRTHALAIALLLSIALLASYHAAAHARYRASFGDDALLARISSADRARDLEPWNRTFEIRWIRLEAERLFLAEEYDAAHALMEPVIAAREFDEDFVEYYHTVSQEWIAWSAGKAHQQHGHEGPGGTLDPEDVVR